ncbi:MAG: GNAT family N-acetyltransferase [Planctomycetota bacterium]
MPELRTPRLLLRRWRDADRAPFAALNADPEVTAYLPGPLSREESDALLERLEAHHALHGFGLWAVEAPGTAPCLGFVGLSIPRFEAAFTPCVEVGWRLAPAHWGQGFATEAARACLRAAFTELDLDEVVSFTVPANLRSRAVMERLGLARDPTGDFAHPALPPGHRLSEHVLYRIRRADWAAREP